MQVNFFSTTKNAHIDQTHIYLALINVTCNVTSRALSKLIFFIVVVATNEGYLLSCNKKK